MALRGPNSTILLAMKVWDRPTRLFHWLIVLTMLVSYVSITIADGANAALWMRVHVLSGETALALLLFRLIWGVVGGETARFATFVTSPLRALHHLAQFRRPEPDTQIGHNAAGGWMVLILLALLFAQVITGLLANDDGSTEGPLVQFVSKSTSDLASGLHGVIFNVLLAAAILHIAAVIAYRVVKRHDLVTPMITGKKRLPAATRMPRMASPAAFGLAAFIAIGVTVIILRL